MHKLFLSGLCASVLLIYGCSDSDSNNSNNCIEPTGVITTEVRSVAAFHSIELEGIGNILLTQGSPQQLSIITHQNLLSLIETTVTNEELHIDLDGCIQGMINQFDILITMPDIEKLELQGVGNIVGQNDFNLDTLEVELDGVGEVTMSGTVDYLEITSSGVGNVMAFDLISQACEVTVLGVGNVEVTAEVELDVTISGAGNVFYKGDPSIDANISGEGNLINAN